MTLDIHVNTTDDFIYWGFHSFRNLHRTTVELGSLEEEEPLLEQGAGLLVDVLADLIGELVGVLAGGGDPHRARPVVVHVGQLVGHALNKIG